MQGCSQRGVVALVPAAIRTEYEGNEAGIVAQQRVIESPLPQLLAAGSAHAEHGAGQADFGGVTGVERADRFVVVLRQH